MRFATPPQGKKNLEKNLNTLTTLPGLVKLVFRLYETAFQRISAVPLFRYSLLQGSAVEWRETSNSEAKVGSRKMLEWNS